MFTKIIKSRLKVYRQNIKKMFKTKQKTEATGLITDTNVIVTGYYL